MSRSSLCYQPRPVSVADLAIMRRVDEFHLAYPFAGSRVLRGEGLAIGRAHVMTLMKRMAIEAIGRRPNTSKPAPGHKVYICCAARGGPAGPSLGDGHNLHAHEAGLCLSGRDGRLVQPLAWRGSIGMEVDSCLKAVEEALATHWSPEIFNPD